jgi:hypothetical protein
MHHAHPKNRTYLNIALQTGRKVRVIGITAGQLQLQN